MSRKANFSARERTKIKATILGILEKSPFIGLACKKVGISRQTFYRWQENDKDFKEDAQKAINLGNEDVLELGEGKLLENVHKGDMRAIKFLLENRHDAYKKNKPMAFRHSEESTNRIIILPSNGRDDWSKQIKPSTPKKENYYKCRNNISRVCR